MAKYIPETHYVTWKEFAEKNPLAFMTVYGTDAAAKKRMATADDWAGRSNKPGLGSVKTTFENKPATGFEIGKEVRRWTTSNVVWRVNDPRGFQLEISSGNMAYLMANCVINKGVIEAELIWVRDGADNYLLPTDSEEYKQYQKITTAKTSDTKMSDLKPGDYAQFATGEEGTYLGMYTFVQFASHDLLVRTARYHVVRNEKNKANGYTKYIGKTSWKGITILEKGKHENKDYSEEMIEHIDDVNCSAWYRVDHVCIGKFDIAGTLQTLHKIPFVETDKVRKYQYTQNGVEYTASRNRYDDRAAYWTGWTQVVELKVALNQYERGESMYITDNSYGRKHVLPDVIANLDKYNYAITVNGKLHVLQL